MSPAMAQLAGQLVHCGHWVAEPAEAVVGILIVIIVVDILALAVVMRLVLTEPPHQPPSTHPFVLAEQAQDRGDGESA